MPYFARMFLKRKKASSADNMDFLSSKEVFESVLYAIAFGLSFGVFRFFVGTVLDYIEELVAIPTHVIRVTESREAFKSALRSKIALKRNSGNVKLFIKDIIVFLTAGIVFSIVLYAATDGVFRVYMLALSVLFAWIFSITFGRLLTRVFSCFLKFLLNFLIFCTSFLIFPIRKGLMSIIKRCIALDKRSRTC